MKNIKILTKVLTYVLAITLFTTQSFAGSQHFPNGVYRCVFVEKTDSHWNTIYKFSKTQMTKLYTVLTKNDDYITDGSKSTYTYTRSYKSLDYYTSKLGIIIVIDRYVTPGSFTYIYYESKAGNFKLGCKYSPII